jgi:Fibronectin type III domain.
MKEPFYIFRFKADWEPAGECSPDKCEATVKDLKEGNEFQFRIIAVNKAGPSEPSDASKLHLVKHKNCKISEIQ